MTNSPEPLDGSVVTDEPGELLTVSTDMKKSRRQTAIYPNTLRAAPKPFSRSAAKRESVMALGSIEHLQHYFTKTGIVAKQRPMVRTKGLVPAIGGRNGHVRAASSVTSIPELPPSPMVPLASSRPPFVHLPKTYEVDPAQLKPGVIRDLRAVEHAWRIDTPKSNDQLTPTPEVQAPDWSSPGFDVLATLRTTTHAIRSVRDYVVSLPDDHPTHTGKGLGPYRSSAFSAPGTKKDPVVQMNLGVQSLASVLQATSGTLPTLPVPSGRSVSGSSSASGVPSSPVKPRPSLPAQNTGTSAQSQGQSTQPFPSRAEEPLALVRRAALDVLISLRALEERARIPGAEPDPSTTASHSRLATRSSHDALSASSRSDTPADRVGSPGMFYSGDEADRDSATSFPTSTLGTSSSQAPLPRLRNPGGVSTETVLVHGRGAVQVWSDSDEEDFFADEPEKREVWDEKLVLGGGWLYRSDLSVEDVAAERAAVGRYLDVVDAVLFRGGRGVGKRGWDRERRKGRKSELASGRETPANSSVMSDSEDESMTGSRRISGVLSEAMKYLSVMEDDTVVEEDEEEGEDEEGLPEWATVEPFGSDLIGRTNALLRYLLPPHLIPHLPESPTRETLLAALSDGQMLCVAYNAGVRKSRKAWGFINAQSIHATATATSEEKATGSWTFRRRENLGLWAAALKLRYVIDIVPAEPKSTHPTRHFHQAPKPEGEVGTYAPNQFSPIVIAKHESGWEDMLERAIWQWVNALVTERKQEAPE